MKIPVYERQVNIGGLPNAAVGGVGNAASFGSDVGGAVQALGGRLMKIQQDREDARTFELMNEFKRESFVYHEDAEKGVYNTRKFGNASNVYADSDEWLAGKIEDYEGRAPSGRAARNFRRMAEQYRAQRGERNSMFEADQLRAYRDAECDASVALAVDSAAGNFDDDAAFNAAVNDIDEALAFKTEGMGDGAKQAARDDAINKLAQARLEAMAQADPERAEVWFNANKGLFKGSDLAKLAARLSNASLGRRLINEVDEAFESYDNEADALEYLRGRFADPEEYERAAKRYKAKAADAEAAYRKREKQWIDEITDDIANSGSLEEALAIIQERGADGDDRVKLESYAASVFKAEKVNEHPLHYLQAFEEVTSGKLPDLMSFHARWGEYLNNDTIKTLGKMYITGNFGSGSGAAGSQYVGYSLAESIKGRIKALKLEGAQAASMITYMNDVINSAKAEKRRGGGGALSPNDIEAMLDDCVKREIISGSEGLFGLGGTKTFTYIQRQAEEHGYKWDSSAGKYLKRGELVYDIDPQSAEFDPKRAEAEGYVFDQSSNRYVKSLVYEIDPKNMEYDPNSVAIEKREAAPLPPLPEKPNAAPVKREAGARMMRDGSAFDEGLRRVPGKRRKAEVKDKEQSPSGSGFERAVGMTLKFEGGYAADDNGRGPVNRGVLETTLKRAQSAGVVDKDIDIKDLSESDAKRIYEKYYYKGSGADKLPYPLDALHFDAAVNLGVNGAFSVLKKALRSMGGSFGKVSTASDIARAVSSLDDEERQELAELMLDERDARYDRLAKSKKGNAKYLGGWKSRTKKLRGII